MRKLASKKGVKKTLQNEGKASPLADVASDFQLKVDKLISELNPKERILITISIVI
jgi:hypothetical protein